MLHRVSRFGVSVLFALAAVIVVASSAHAEDINIDFSNTYGLPLATEAGPAARPGTWNGCNLTSWTTTLVDVGGNATGASVTVSHSGTGTVFDGNAAVSPLTGDNFFVDSGGYQIAITGLSDGLYEVYLIDPSHISVGTGSGDVNGVPFSNLNYGTQHSGTWIQGQTYHGLTNVVVSGGTMTVSASLVGTYSGIAGMQLVQVTEACNIAFFYDGAYVDVTATSPFEAEAINMRQDLLAMGHSVTTFTGTTQAAWAAALASADVLVIPELESGDLAAALDAATEGEIAAFVQGGGGLIIVQDNSGRSVALLNSVFGYALIQTSGVASTITTAAAGTAFAGGPGALGNPSATFALTSTSLPAGAASIYAAGTSTTVALIPESGGQVVSLGWDWFQGVGTSAEWIEVLARSVQQVCPAGPVPPTIECPSDQDVECAALSTLTFTVDHPAGEALTVTFDVDSVPVPSETAFVAAGAGATPVAFDFTFGGPPGTTFDVTATVTASGGGEVTCTVTVTSEDTTPPVITLLGSSPVFVECGIDSYMDAGATAADTCDGDLTSSIVAVNPVNEGVPNTYTVTYNVSDSSGNAATQVTRTVVVQDTTPPVITILGDNPATVECATPYMDAGATALDACAGDLTSSIFVTNLVNTSVPGTYQVGYQVTDPAGLTTLVARTVNVVDTTPPVITLLGDNPMTLECGVDTYVEPGATALDTCAGDLTSSIVISGTVNTNAVGTYTITYDVADPAGNTAQETRTVNVVDTLPPVITCSIQRTLLWPARNGLIPIGFSASALDACQGPVSVTVTIFSDEGNGPPPFAPDAIGTQPADTRLRMERAFPGNGRVYLVRVTASDAFGNAASVCKSVIVPVMPVGTWILNVRAQAAAGEAACAAGGPFGPAPAGYVTLLQYTWPLAPM